MHGCADGAGARERVEMRGEKGARIRMEMGGEKGHVAVGMSEGGCADVHGRCGGEGTDGNGCHGEGPSVDAREWAEMGREKRRVGNLKRVRAALLKGSLCKSFPL